MDEDPGVAPRVDWSFELREESHVPAEEATRALSRAKDAATVFRESVRDAEAAAVAAEDAIRVASESGVSNDALAAELGLSSEGVAGVVAGTGSLLPQLT